MGGCRGRGILDDWFSGEVRFVGWMIVHTGLLEILEKFVVIRDFREVWIVLLIGVD